MGTDADTDGILDALASTVLGTDFDDLPEVVVENTKSRTLDMIGCALGGSGLDDVRALAATLGAPTGGFGATGIGFGQAFPVHDAAMVNCIAGRSFDWGPLTLVFDDGRIPSHISETTVLTGVAVGEHRQITGQELITSIVVGDDLAARIWLAAGDRPMPGEGSGPASGFEQWGTVTTFSAAAIAGRIFGLRESELKHALALSISMMSGAGHGLWDGATSFKLSQGAAARNGILAARLAQAGWTGIDDPLLGDRGYYSIFETGCDALEWLHEDLGSTFYVEECFKPYPGGRPTDAPIEAAIRLAREDTVDPAEVEELIVRPKALSAHYAKPYEVGEYPTGHALFSFKYAAASALVNGRAGNEEYTPAAVKNPKVQELIERTTLEPTDREVDPGGAEVEVRTSGGRSMRKVVPVPRGDPPNPMSTDELIEKFEAQARFAGTVDQAAVEDIVDRIDDLEDADDVSPIPSLARGKQVDP